jgi:UDP-N-acetyl-D-mannosaminuronate dehydrogenase
MRMDSATLYLPPFGVIAILGVISPFGVIATLSCCHFDISTRERSLGLTFKENCPDVRNTKVVDVVKEFETYGADVDVYDPWVDKQNGVRLRR